MLCKAPELCILFSGNQSKDEKGSNLKFLFSLSRVRRRSRRALDLLALWGSGPKRPSQRCQFSLREDFKGEDW